MIRALYLFLFLSTVLVSQAQFPPVDDIRAKVRTAATPAAELEAIMALTPFRNSLNADTAAVYFTRARQLALQLNDRKRLRWAEYMLLSSELTRGKTDSVIQKIELNPVFRFPKAEDPELYFKLALLKANVLNRTNERTRALELQLDMMEEADKDGNQLAQCFFRNYIGASYLNSGKLPEARAVWFEALQLCNSKAAQPFREIEATIHSNLALYYFQRIDSLGNKPMVDSFNLYNYQVIEAGRTAQVYWLLATALTFRGEFNGMMGKWKEGEADFREALDIRRRIGDPLYTINDLFRLAGFYLLQQEKDSALAVLQQSMQEIKRAHINEALLRVSGLMSYVYKQKGDYKAYSQALEQFILDADTAMRLNAADKINDISARYDLQKKETVIANQKLELAQRTIYIGLTLLLLGLTVTAFYFYFRVYKRKQAERNFAAVQEAENRERKRIAAELHDNMGVHANAILHNTSLLAGSGTANPELIHNLQDTAREMLGSLRETVWALKNTDVSSADTWLRLVNFVQQSKRNFSGITFSITGTAPEGISLASVKALHIIMVIKEAVTNSIKHAGATEIAIVGTYTNQWEIRITDNGKGFSMENLQIGVESNGLQNMKDRALAGGFSVAVSSEPGKGTEVSLRIPV